MYLAEPLSCGHAIISRGGVNTYSAHRSSPLPLHEKEERESDKKRRVGWLAAAAPLTATILCNCPVRLDRHNSLPSPTMNVASAAK